ncbi:unnamed protein product [Paramecium octaurelia]|uniref:C2 domain-containing protein n=1 Tax=Paramecium octaurelia TaxID=43137 RepID=A0A8S1WWM8_PAROT|nr:unnamed protein product [Paramecium octaurelia]
MNDLYGRSASTVESQQKLELFISCRGLANMDTFSKSDPYVIMYVKRNNQWSEVGRTEIIKDNLNPNFSKSFIIEYYFECQQPLKFICNDDDGHGQYDFIGSAETTLANIAGARDQLAMLNLSNGQKKTGVLVVRADQVRMINDKIVMQISADNLPNTRFLPWHSTSPFYRLYRIRKDTNQSLLVYESEPIKCNLKPIWKRVDIQAQKLCNGDYFMPIRIEVWDYRTSGNHEHICSTDFSVDEMKDKQKTKKILLDKNKKQSGFICFNEFKLIEKPSFLDYLQSGTQINLIAAIDFTASNQSPKNPSSLHYIDDQYNRMNQYQQALLAVGEILLNYDHDKSVPIFGFGCKPRLQNLNTPQTLHCFPLNGNPQNPEVFQMDGIMQTYNYAVRNVQFDGPTYFNPIIQESMKIAQACKDMGTNTYFVLFILTDGEIHDMKQTIDSIVASSHLPISIIIVGVGDADFTNMSILDDDDGNLRDSFGKRTQRDLVQFVPFNQFKSNPELLAKNVLQELPDQLVDYMLLIGRKPGQKNFINLGQFDINQYSQQYGIQQQVMPPNQQPFQQQVSQIPQQQFQNMPPPPQQFQQPPPPYGQTQQVYQPQQSSYPSQQPPQYPTSQLNQFPPQQPAVYQQQQQFNPPPNYQQQQQMYPPQQPPQQSKFVQGLANTNFLGQHINDAQQQQINQQLPQFQYPPQEQQNQMGMQPQPNLYQQPKQPSPYVPENPYGL